MKGPRAAAKARGENRYLGTVCPIHPEAKGVRYVSGTQCPHCAMKKVADYRASPRGRINVLANARKRKYNVDAEQFDALLASQASRCAICRTDTPGGRDNTWHLDHDHLKNKVRGVLCARCNVGLGHFGDSVTVLFQAANYLAKFV